MFRLSLAAWLLSVAILSPLASHMAWAQATAHKPDPSDAKASVPPLIFESSFARHRAFAEQEVAPWKETNDTAGRIGGWRVYAREAREPGSSDKAEPAAIKPVPVAPAKPMPGTTGGRSMNHGGRHE